MPLSSPFETRNIFNWSVLLCVTGLTPQIITETLYALLIRDGPDTLPGEIQIVTTASGRELIENNLIDRAGPRYLAQFLEHYRLEPESVRLDIDDIHVICDEDGRPLADIRDREANDAAADLICELVRKLTSAADTRIHASIAGGRKTMGFYLGYAMSLFGRPQDELSHVLVNPPFESHHEFYFPPREPRMLVYGNGRESRRIRTDKAEVSLASIPFVQLRHGLPTALLEGKATFQRAVELAQRGLARPELIIDPHRALAVCSGEEIRLPPAQLSLLAWMADRARAGHDGIWRHEITDEDQSQYLDWRRRISGSHSGRTERLETALESNRLDQDYFDSLKSRLNRTLERVLGAELSRHFQIRQLQRTRPAPFGLGLKPEQISFVRRQAGRVAGR